MVFHISVPPTLQLNVSLWRLLVSLLNVLPSSGGVALVISLNVTSPYKSGEHNDRQCHHRFLSYTVPFLIDYNHIAIPSHF
jgi:hypothetical protein